MVADPSGSRVGEVLNGRYRLDELIGTGGMGEVYRATNTGVNRTVAIKTLRPEYARNQQLVERFMREARAHNLVQHPNVASVLDVDRDANGVPFMVQEFLDGEDLASILEQFPEGMPPGMALTILLPIIECVAAAHAQNIVHRDLKPENVFLARLEGVTVPKVLDFGISKMPEREGSVRLTGTNMIIGSPAYMSPEQIISPKKVDVRSDVWSLGVMLYELLSGKLPFEASGDALFVKICRDDPIALEEAAPHVPAQFTEIARKCLQRDPEQRFRNASHLATQFAGIREMLNVPSASTAEAPSGKDTQAQGTMDPMAFGATVFAAPAPVIDGQAGAGAAQQSTFGFPMASVPPVQEPPGRGAKTQGAPSPASLVRGGADPVSAATVAARPAAVQAARGYGPSAATSAAALAGELTVRLRPGPDEQAENSVKVVSASAIAKAFDFGPTETAPEPKSAIEQKAKPARVDRARRRPAGGLTAVEQLALKRAREREYGETLVMERFYPAIKGLVLALTVFLLARLIEQDALQAVQRTIGSAGFYLGSILALVMAYTTVILFRTGVESSSVSLIAASGGNALLTVCLAVAGGSLGPLPNLGEYTRMTSMLAPWSAVLLAVGMAVHGVVRGIDELREPGTGRKLYGAALFLLALLSALMAYQMARHAAGGLEDRDNLNAEIRSAPDPRSSPAVSTSSRSAARWVDAPWSA